MYIVDFNLLTYISHSILFPFLILRHNLAHFFNLDAIAFKIARPIVIDTQDSFHAHIALSMQIVKCEPDARL